jgi:tetratricopeptide (TPR) repeat protein
VSSYWTGRGLEFWSKTPAAAIGLALKKFGFFWKAFEFPDVMDLDLASGYSKVLSMPLVPFALLAPLALLGMIVAWLLRPRDALGIWLLLALLVANVGFMMLFFVSSRFRLSVVPCLIPFAAAAVVWLVVRARARRFGSVAMGAAALGVFALFVNVDPAETAAATQGNVARSHSNLGQMFYLDKRLPEAEREFREAVRLMPSYAKPRYYLAEVLYETNRQAEAERTFQEALSLDPKYAKGRAWWGRLLIDWKHDPKRAIPVLEQALHDDPNEIDAAVWLGVALAQVGRKSEAITIWQHVAEVDPTRADDVKKRIAELSGS